MQININKDIDKEYQTTSLFGLTYKQLLFAGLGAVVMIAVFLVSYFVLGVSPQLGALLGLPLALPLFILGFKNFNGLSAFEFLKAIRYEKNTNLLLYETDEMPQEKNKKYTMKREDFSMNSNQKKSGNKIMYVILILLIIQILMTGFSGYMMYDYFTSDDSNVVQVEPIEPSIEIETDDPAPSEEESEEETDTETSSEETEDSVFPLSEGDTNNQVETLQAALISLGYDSIEASGTYDDATRSVVMAYQANAGYELTGVVEENLYNEIINASAPDNQE